MNKLAVLHDYLHYYFSSKTRYGIHSPFVYDFICNVLNQKTKFAEVHDIEIVRSELKKNHSIISITDYGAGSSQTQNTKRTISEIAKHSLKNRKYASLLFRMVKYYHPKKILELGTSLGITTCYLAKANPSSEIITIEGCREISDIAKATAQKIGCSNIQFIVGNFNDLLANTVEKHKPEFVFFDGNHTEEATLNYFTTCLSNITNDSIFVFDDINWSEGMKSAWANIKKHPSVSVTIDLYFLGLVFFRKELSKEDFIIRF